MKPVKAFFAVAAICLLAVPAMAGSHAVRKENRNQSTYQTSGGSTFNPQRLARGGNGNSGGAKGHGPGNGTGTGGNGPKDGSGPRSQNGTCTNS